MRCPYPNFPGTASSKADVAELERILRLVAREGANERALAHEVADWLEQRFSPKPTCDRRPTAQRPPKR